jgi:ArsR family transcriptional regulator, arsenate/arsenite/antimonite-responsive transcriptional repressor
MTEGSDMESSAELARFFKALGDETRLRLVVLLARQEPGTALCVSRLARELDTTVPNVSQHLRILKDLGLVYGERRRARIHYYLNDARFRQCFVAMQGLLSCRYRLDGMSARREGE